MARISRRNLLASSIAVPIIGHGAHAERATPPHGFAPAESGREVLRKRLFPDVELITHNRRQMRFYSDLLEGKIVVLNLMYADCTGVCPTITAHLLRAQRILGQRVNYPIQIYSLTINPKEDTPEKLREYAQMHGISRNWTLLTGKPEKLELLRRSLGYVDPKPDLDKDKARHSGMLRYGNEPQCLWGSCQGSAHPEWIAEEISFVVPQKYKKVAPRHDS